MGQCYVKAYYDWIEQTAALSDAERGRLFIAILEYARSGLEPKLDGRESILFPVFRAILDRDNKKSCTYSENGKKGGRGNKAMESQLKQNKANESENNNIRHKTEDKRQKTQDEDKDERVSRAKRFTPPTVEEVAAYVKERGSDVDAQRFVDFYSSKGWAVGKNPMKDWRAAVRTWEGRDKPAQSTSGKRYGWHSAPETAESAAKAQQDIANMRKLCQRIGGEDG